MFLFLALLSLAAHADDCDPRGLRHELVDAGGVRVATLYTRLAACDPEGAARVAGEVLPRVLAGPEGTEAVLVAIDVGATDAARAWLEGLLPDERSETLRALGDRCDEDPAIATFLAGLAPTLGQRFWSERWYRALAACRAPEVQALLAREIASPSMDRSRFLGVLEVYARNLGRAAIPRLAELAAERTDPEELVYVVNAFADAAGVGSPGGPDPEAAAEAAAAIRAIAPRLPEPALLQARTTLQALGHPGAAGRLVAARYADRLGPDGSLTYGLVVVDHLSCRRGERSVAWTGVLIEPATRWPDELAPLVVHAIEGLERPFPRRCTPDGSPRILLPDEPLDEAARQAWVEARLAELAREAGGELETNPLEAPLRLPPEEAP